MPALHAQPGVQPVAYAGAAETIFVELVDSSGVLVTGHTGTPTVQLLKAGGSAWGNPSDGVWVEVGNGVYRVRLDATDKNTFGPMVVRVIASTPTSIETHAWVHVGVNLEERRAEYVRVRALHTDLT